eukprot:6192345-Pleurochrysis_carterae.AAC.1
MPVSRLLVSIASPRDRTFLSKKEATAFAPPPPVAFPTRQILFMGCSGLFSRFSRSITTEWSVGRAAGSSGGGAPCAAFGCAAFDWSSVTSAMVQQLAS